MAIPVHVPYDERLVGKIARPDYRVRIGPPQPQLEVGGVLDAFLHRSLDLTDEIDVVGRIQE